MLFQVKRIAFELVQNLNKTFNGKGGGRDTYAQGKITATKEEILNFIAK